MTPRDCALLCQQAYREHTFRDEKWNIEVLMLWDDYRMILTVAFRGTEKNHEDILTDIRFLPWWDKDIGWCHAGFLKSVRDSNVWPILRKLIIKHPGHRVIFTGHSLGGAQATIAAALMARTIHSPRALVTFGSPRVGRSLSGRWRSMRSIRFVNAADVVPTLPCGIFYRHVPYLSQSYYPSEGRFHDHKIQAYVDWMEKDTYMGSTPLI